MRRSQANPLLSSYDEPIHLSSVPCARPGCCSVGISEGGVVACGTDDNGAFELAWRSVECARACGAFDGLKSEKEPARVRRKELKCQTS